MNTDKNKRLDALVLEAKKYQKDREGTYRERAIKMYPWVCGRCSREFTRLNLQELTVHHRDHDHDNNPADGSNWELLCVYCHDNEHSRYIDQVRYGSASAGEVGEGGTTHNPFGGLAGLLKKD